MKGFVEKERVDERVADFGPVITDEEFFSLLNTDIPKLGASADAFSRGEVKDAYRLFHEAIKEICDPVKFYTRGNGRFKPEATEALISRAEDAMNHKFVSVGVPIQFTEDIDWSANPTENNYSEWNIQLHRHAELCHLSNAYRATGDERYATELVRLLLHWIRNVPRCKYDSNTYSASYSWRSLECAGRLSCWTDMIHGLLDSPAFTPEACVTIYKSLYEHCVRVTTVYTHGNWYFIELCGMAIFTTATPVFEKCKEWRCDVARRVMEALESAVYPDGSEYELAPGYAQVCLLDAKGVEEIFRTYGYSMPDRFYEIIRLMLEFYVKVTMADGVIPGVNDSPHTKACAYATPYLASYFGASDAVRWIATSGKEGREPEYKSVYLPYGGIVALRTGWGEGDISAYFDAGKFGIDHFHEDKLNLLIHSDKKALVTECGTYAYDASAMRNYCTQTEGHNTVLVDGLGQTRFFEHYTTGGAQWAFTEEDVTFREGDRLDYAGAYYDETYGVYDCSKYKRPEVASERIAIHNREVILMKRPASGKPYFIAVDTMTDRVGGSHDYTALWHVNVTEEELVINDGKISSSEITILTAGFDKIESLCGSEEPYQGWLCRSSTQGDYYAAPTLLCHAFGERATFATLFAIGAPDEIAVKGVELSADGAKLTVTYRGGEADEIDLAAYRK